MSQNLFKQLFVILAAFIFSVKPSSAQTTNYNAYVNNITQLSPTELQFEIWIENTGTNSLKLGSFPCGINFNAAGIINGGVLSVAFVAGSADASLPAAQQTLSPFISSNGTQIRIPGVNATASTAATIPSAPGFRIGTFILTNTEPFTPLSTPDFSWSFAPNSATNTRTQVAAYVNSAVGATIITISANHSIASNPQLNALLPASIAAFSGKAQQDGNLLMWQTLSETNNAFFTLEQSTNGKDFITLGTIASKAVDGNSNQALNYSFFHQNPASGKNYYRLSQTDIDGKQTIHERIVDLLSAANTLHITVSPNPTLNNARVTISSATSGQYQISLFDMQGRTTFSNSIAASTQSFTITLPMEDFPVGLYTLVVSNSTGKIYSGKIEKK